MIPAAALRIDARIPRVAAWLLSTLLLACGGSGGSDGTPLSVGVSKGPVEGATCSLLDDADALVGRAVRYAGSPTGTTALMASIPPRMKR